MKSVRMNRGWSASKRCKRRRRRRGRRSLQTKKTITDREAQETEKLGKQPATNPEGVKVDGLSFWGFFLLLLLRFLSTWLDLRPRVMVTVWELAQKTVLTTLLLCWFFFFFCPKSCVIVRLIGTLLKCSLQGSD